MMPRIMYIECKTNLSGEARIGRVTFTRSGKTVFYRQHIFRRVRGYKYNHHDKTTGDNYWISGCKKDGSDRLYGERVPIHIDEDVREEYWRDIRQLPDRVKDKVT